MDSSLSSPSSSHNVSSGCIRDPVIIIKIGSSSILSNEYKVSLQNLASLAQTVSHFKELNCNVILVTSGSVGLGAKVMGMEMPKKSIERQAYAAIGQSKLMSTYTEIFNYYDLIVAQVLLSRNIFDDEPSFNSTKRTLDCLLDKGVVPILNENDTLSDQGVKFGDNDYLSAMVSGMVKAEYLFLLTDVDALYDSNPFTNESAMRIADVCNIEEVYNTVSMDGSSSNYGTGGMLSKVNAAQLCTAAGCTCVITSVDKVGELFKVLDNENNFGTIFHKSTTPINDKKIFISHGLFPMGTLVIDDGAKDALYHKAALFAAGIRGVKGRFPSNVCVKIVDQSGMVIAKGISNYNSEDLHMIRGKNSGEIEGLLESHGPEEVIFRNNLAIIYSVDDSKSLELLRESSIGKEISEAQALESVLSN